MDWSNETYVKVYTRETDDDLALSWEARAVWAFAMTKFDRSGVIATKRGARGLAAMLRMPIDVVERVLPELLEDGRLTEHPSGFIAPNYIEAQEATKSDKLRQKESRERRRSGVTERDDDVTNRDAPVTFRDETSRDVTRRHDASRDVTLCLAKQSEAEQSEQSPARAGQPRTPPPEASGEREPDPTLGRTQVAPAPPAFKSSWTRRQEVWQFMRETHAKLRAEGIGANAPELAPQCAGESEKLVARCERHLVESGYVGDALDEKFRHVIRVAEAEARRENHLDWFKPALIFDVEGKAKGFLRALDTEVAAAARPKPSARASPSKSTATARMGRPLPNLANLPEER